MQSFGMQQMMADAQKITSPSKAGAVTVAPTVPPMSPSIAPPLPPVDIAQAVVSTPIANEGERLIVLGVLTEYLSYIPGGNKTVSTLCFNTSIIMH